MARSKSIGVRAALGIGNAEAIAALADPKLISAWKQAIGQYRDALQDETASWDKRSKCDRSRAEHRGHGQQPFGPISHFQLHV